MAMAVLSVKDTRAVASIITTVEVRLVSTI